MIRFEIKKIFSKTITKVGLIVLLIALVVSCYQAITSKTYVDEQGKTHTGISAVKDLQKMKQEWAGVLSEDLLRQVIRENKQINQEYPYDPADVVTSNIGYSKKQGFADIRDLINRGFSDFREYNYWQADSLAEDEVGSLYENRVRILKEWLYSDEATDQFTENEKAFLIAQYENLETPFYYEPADGWQAALEYLPMMIMLIVLVLSFFVSGIFSNEFQWKAESIFFSTKYGRNRGTFAKMAAGFLVVTAIYWVVILIYSVVVFGVMGLSGANCAIQIDGGYWKSFYNITYWQTYILTILGGYIGAVFILFVSMLVSAKTHTTVLSVTIPFIIIFLQSFLGGFTSLADILGLLPDQLLQINMAIRTFTLYDIGGKIVGAVPILLIVYTVLSVLILPLMYRIYHVTEIK